MKNWQKVRLVSILCLIPGGFLLMCSKEFYTNQQQSPPIPGRGREYFLLMSRFNFFGDDCLTIAAVLLAIGLALMLASRRLMPKQQKF